MGYTHSPFAGIHDYFCIAGSRNVLEGVDTMATEVQGVVKQNINENNLILHHHAKRISFLNPKSRTSGFALFRSPELAEAACKGRVIKFWNILDSKAAYDSPANPTMRALVPTATLYLVYYYYYQSTLLLQLVPQSLLPPLLHSFSH